MSTGTDECEAACDEHKGAVTRVRVKHPKTGHDWGEYLYCEAAREADESHGLEVVEVQAGGSGDREGDLPRPGNSGSSRCEISDTMRKDGEPACPRSQREGAGRQAGAEAPKECVHGVHSEPCPDCIKEYEYEQAIADPQGLRARFALLSDHSRAGGTRTMIKRKRINAMSNKYERSSHNSSVPIEKTLQDLFDKCDALRGLDGASNTVIRIGLLRRVADYIYELREL